MSGEHTVVENRVRARRRHQRGEALQTVWHQSQGLEGEMGGAVIVGALQLPEQLGFEVELRETPPPPPAAEPAVSI